jgi:hypothetical protein
VSLNQPFVGRPRPDSCVSDVCYQQLTITVEAEPEIEATGICDYFCRAIKRDAVDLPRFTSSKNDAVGRHRDTLRVVESTREDGNALESYRVHRQPFLVRCENSRRLLATGCQYLARIGNRLSIVKFRFFDNDCR